MARDGRQIFYVATDGRLMEVALNYAADADPTGGTLVALFTTRITYITEQPFHMSADGQRFLIKTEPFVQNPIHIIENRQPKP